MPESKPQEQNTTDAQMNKHLKTLLALEVQHDNAWKAGNTVLRTELEAKTHKICNEINELFEASDDQARQSKHA